MTIEKRIERIEAILDARGLDWDHPRVSSDHFAGASKMVSEEPAKEAPEPITLDEFLRSIKPPEPAKPRESGPEVKATNHFADANKMVAEEPAKEPEHPAWPKPDPGKGYRLLSKDPPEELQEGDELQCVDGIWGASANARTHKRQGPSIWYRRKIETAKEPEPPASEKPPEPEHSAGPMPEPGDGYRILSKEPLEDLTPGDEFEDWNGAWIRSSNAETTKKQGANCWYRRKIEVAKTPEPEYREPVLPADEGKWCEFSEDGRLWVERKLLGYRCHVWLSVSMELGSKAWVHARIKVDA